uniref:Flower buds specific protein AP3X n=2 Tax=Silene latifolia TaxID=37657 RepID=E2J8W6_SILLA|nr:flower buds specific protein AP3X [Silene latifolia]BAJ16179.1 flower buds-specific protein SlAP3X [Silene latifolia subsp. alba]
MGRGKLEIKKIENKTNRQVTFSKRRNGIMKKAQELTVLCDAKVSLLMISSTHKLYHFLSPGVSLKKMYDEYQKIKGVDLWLKHWEEMQEEQRKMVELNNMLRTEISRRLGGDLEGLTLAELRGLQQEMDEAITEIRNRKYNVIKNQTGTTRKKVKNLEERHGDLLMDLEAKFGGAQFGTGDGEQGNYDSASMYGNEGAAANLFALSLHPY